jgi:hypothetical protein
MLHCHSHAHTHTHTHSIVRAFLIEEQKIVKRVLNEKKVKK